MKELTELRTGKTADKDAVTVETAREALQRRLQSATVSIRVKFDETTKHVEMMARPTDTVRGVIEKVLSECGRHENLKDMEILDEDMKILLYTRSATFESLDTTLLEYGFDGSCEERVEFLLSVGERKVGRAVRAINLQKGGRAVRAIKARKKIVAQESAMLE